MTNFGSFGSGDALAFFKQSGSNLLKAARRNGVGHYLALSVVGAETLVENDYFRAKLVQENLIRASGIPYTIVRSTQFFEFLSGILGSSAEYGAIRLPALRLQPIAGDEAASWLAKRAGESPSNSIVEIGGPEATNLIDLAGELLTINEDTRPATADPEAQYFGILVPTEGLIPKMPVALGRLTTMNGFRGRFTNKKTPELNGSGVLLRYLRYGPARVFRSTPWTACRPRLCRRSRRAPGGSPQGNPGPRRMPSRCPPRLPIDESRHERSARG